MILLATNSYNFALASLKTIANDDPALNSRLPAVTLQNLTAIRSVINTDPDVYNAYVNAMVTRIGRVYMNTPTFINPLRALLRGENPMAHMVQEIFFEPIAAESDYKADTISGTSYAGAYAGANPLGRRSFSNIKVAYHRQNYQPCYCVTIDRAGLMDALADWDSLNRFWGAQMQAMYTGAAIDEYNAFRQLIATAIADDTSGKVLPTASIGTFSGRDADSGKKLAQSIDQIATTLTFPNRYNQTNVLNVTAKSELILLLNKDVKPNLDVYTLASLFNEEFATLKPRIIEIDTFAAADASSSTVEGVTTTTYSNPDVLGVLTTKAWFQYYETMRSVRPIENPQGLFTNFFLHVWGTMQLSPYAPCVVLKKVASES